MKVVGITAEYNPFHSGHVYHLREAKKQAGADFAVVVMSPDFVQRGEPAVFDKYTRAKMALLNGADLVLELPVCYASGSAEYFAQGAVSILDGLGVVDVLSFGCEGTGCGFENSGKNVKWNADAEIVRTYNAEKNQRLGADAALFWEIARILNCEPEIFKKTLRSYLARGISFPKAREKALLEYLKNGEEAVLSKVLSENFLEKPNNILAVEYCRAILRLGSRMEILPVIRVGSGYHEERLDERFCSATALRKAVLSGESSSSVRRYIPENLYRIYDEVSAQPLAADDFLPVLMQQLLKEKKFDHIQDISPDLSDRICSLRFGCIGKTYGETVEFLAAKQLTKARVRRALLHLILGIRADQTEKFRQNGFVYYAKVLGFRKGAAPLLHEIKKASTIPLLSRNADAARRLGSVGQEMLFQNFEASHLYRGMQALKYGTHFRSEYEMSPVISDAQARTWKSAAGAACGPRGEQEEKPSPTRSQARIIR